MFKLAPYFAGGLAALVAMDFAPPVKSAFEHWTGASSSAQLVNIVDRTGKGDRLVPARAAASTIGKTSPLGRSIVIPVSVQDKERAAAKPGSVQPAPKPAVHGSKLLIGCDPAFSPLAASASLNFAGRCVS